MLSVNWYAAVFLELVSCAGVLLGNICDTKLAVKQQLKSRSYKNNMILFWISRFVYNFFFLGLTSTKTLIRHSMLVIRQLLILEIITTRKLEKAQSFYRWGAKRKKRLRLMLFYI